MANARRRTQRTSRTAARVAARHNPAAGAAPVAEELRTGGTIDWQNEMKYINKDLRQLLIISASLFVLLFVAGFFL